MELMELAARAAAVCVTAALLGLVVKEGAPALSLLLSLGAAAAVLLALTEPAGELAALFRELGERSGLSAPLLSPLYKTLCVAAVVRVGGGLCRDAGASALAAAVETAGAVCALAVSLPLLRAVLELLLELMA